MRSQFNIITIYGNDVNCGDVVHGKYFAGAGVHVS